MVDEDADQPGGTVDLPTDDVGHVDAGSNYTADDFRLRLDSPLFHRDGGLGGVAQAPQLRELTWEHVVRPTGEVDALGSTDAPGDVLVGGDVLVETQIETAADPAPQLGADLATGSTRVPALSIESLLVQSSAARASAQVHVDRDESAAVDDLPEADDSATASPAAHRVPTLPTLSSLASAPAPQRQVDDVVEQLAAEVAREPVADSRSPKPVVSEAEFRPNGAALLAALGHLDDADEPFGAHEHDPSVADLVGMTEPDAEPEPEEEPVMPPAAMTTAAPSTPSAVEAELNRLAYLPDREEQSGPLEVPPIAVAAPVAAAAPPAALTLSQHEMYSPRQSGPTNPARSAFADLVAAAPAPTTRRKKRKAGRSFLTIVVLLGLIGGGLYAAKKYLLAPEWDSEVKALAAEVETARGLSFDHAVDVVTQPVDEYVVTLATKSLSVGDAAEETAAEWRAVGLLNGALDLSAIGLSSLPDAAAFYDHTDETIYVADGVPAELSEFALARALTLALLDQEYGWGDRVDDASPAVAHGTLALYDADALATASALVDDADRDELISQLYELYATFEIPASPSPYASVVAGRLGVALRGYVESMPATSRADVLDGALISDGQALDVRRLVAGGPEAPSGNSRGMLYWYHALAGRVDNDLAWRAALAWRSDAVSTIPGAGGLCVVAKITVDPASVDSVDRAFQQWAAAAPEASGTTVSTTSSDAGAQVTVNACDPGSTVATNDGRWRLNLGAAPLRAEQFRLLIADQPTLPASQAACAVFGADGISMADERGVIDGPEGWNAPMAHPVPDPNRLGCGPV